MHSPARVLSVVTAHTQRIILILLLLLVAALPLALPIQALAQASTATQKSYMAPNVDENVPQNQHTYVQSIFIETFSTVICFLSGIDVIDPTHQCLGLDQKTHKLGYSPQPTTGEIQVGGVVGMTSNLIAGMYVPPASSVDYINDMASNFGFARHTYAAPPPSGNPPSDKSGTGFAGLNVVRDLWKSILNVSYLFFVLIFVLVGVGIMLRVKLDGKTAATLQSSIPRIIITILLVTFSYAIAGFMIDIMWTITYFGINILSQAGHLSPGDATNHLLNNPINYVQNLFSTNIGSTAKISGIPQFTKEIADTVGHILESLIRSVIVGNSQPKCSLAPAVVGGIFSFVPGIGGFLRDTVGGGGSFPDCVQIVLFGTTYWIAAVLGFFVVLAAIVITLFKVWLSLLKAYAYILLDIIIAPIYILAGIIPNSSLGFVSWLRHLAANLIAFPLTAFLFLIAKILIVGYKDGAGQFVPPFVGSPTFNFGAILGFAIFLVTPEAVNIAKDAFKASDNKRAGAAITAGIGAGAKPGLKYAGRGWGSLTQQGGPGKRMGVLRALAAGVPGNLRHGRNNGVYDEYGHINPGYMEKRSAFDKIRFKMFGGAGTGGGGSH